MVAPQRTNRQGWCSAVHLLTHSQIQPSVTFFHNQSITNRHPSTIRDISPKMDRRPGMLIDCERPIHLQLPRIANCHQCHHRPLTLLPPTNRAPVHPTAPQRPSPPSALSQSRTAQQVITTTRPTTGPQGIHRAVRRLRLSAQTESLASPGLSESRLYGLRKVGTSCLALVRRVTMDRHRMRRR